MKMKLLGLIILVGGGVAAWFFLNHRDAVPFFADPYPKELSNLSAPIGLEVSSKGYTILSAANASDLVLAQGYEHGKRAGKTLDQLRRLFRGERVPEVPSDLRDLAELFYYLDLESVAADSERLYPPQLQVLLRRYASGLTEGSAATQAWTIQDVLLLQRGYAFLMGRNFIKDWSAQQLLSRIKPELFQVASDYPIHEFGALSHGLQLNGNLSALFGRPILEPVRLYDQSKTLGCHLRSHPYFAFVFEPTMLQLEERFEAKGVALVGQPFLWAASTKDLTFYRQPVLSDDEQFWAVPDAALFGDVYKPNESASQRTDYPEAPVHGPVGRKMGTLVAGQPGFTYFYDWDGLRPSADLAAAYYLLEAKTLDDAMSVYQYHQVPATELTLRTPKGFMANILFAPSDPNKDRSGKALFSEAYTRIGRRLTSVCGTQFQSSEPWRPDNAGEITASLLDDELRALVRFYLQGPIGESTMALQQQEQILDMLTRDATVARDVFVQHLWQVFFQLFQKEYLGEAMHQAQRGMSLECQRLILQIYGRGARLEDENRETQGNRIRTFANLLDDAWQQWQENDREASYQFPNSHGKLESKKITTFVHSPDSASAWFFLDEGNTINQVASYTVIWGEGFSLWRYPFPTDRSFNDPVEVLDPEASEKMVQIAPKF